jgi:glycosyltransferase involved in cell wall biosynthesis
MQAEKDLGHDTDLVVSSAPSDAGSAKIFAFNLCLKNILKFPIVLWQLRSFLKDNKPDVVICHNTNSALLPLFSALWAGISARVYFNHGVPFVGYKGLSRWGFKLLEYGTLWLATRALTVSRDMLNLLRPIASDTKVSLISAGSACGIELKDYSRDPGGKIDWCKKYGLNVEDLIVLFVGRPVKRKGFDFSIRLFLDCIPDAHLKLVVCGATYEDVRRTIHEVPQNIIPLGFINNLAEVMSYADMLILPSRHEGLSYVALEAQASGLTVVANDIPGLRCAVEHEVNGFLVPPNDPKHYINIIRQGGLNRKSFCQVRQRATIDVKRFSRDVFMADYARFLNKIRNVKTICFVATTPFAVNVFLKDHLLGLAKNYKVVLCVNLGAFRLSNEIAEKVTVIDLAIQRKVSIYQDIKTLIRLTRIIVTNSPSVVHTLTPKAGLLGMLAARISGVPTRCHTFTGQVWVTKALLSRYLLKKLDRFIATIASHVFVDSDSQRNLLYREKIAKDGTVDMLGNGSMSGVDLTRFQPDANIRREKRREVGSSDEACVYLFMGRLTRDKGILDLLAAFKEIAFETSNVELWIVGPDEENLKTDFENGLTNGDLTIRWFGHTSNPQVMMASADILLLPSYREGFGSVIIEAAACEVPAIAYRIDGVVDAIEDGRTGILVDVGDVRLFACAMKRLAIDESFRARLGRQARFRAQQQFNSELVAAAGIDFYRKVLGTD